MPFSPGNAFFEYRITRTLGQGAFGTVYLAQDTLLDRPVAIKELTAAAQADPVGFQRFLQEARAAGSLNHPNIVTVYALKPTDDAVYLVMEYLPGGSLRGLLSQRGRLPVEDAVRIAADVCDGLAAAHAKGIVHRDVKPENILLTADGRAKVGDFGIAHVPRTAGGATVGGLTQTGFQPGTLVYMSPEQIRGEAVDGRSDVYQVGAMLHEMLAGRHYLDIDALTRRAQETTGWFNVLRDCRRACSICWKRRSANTNRRTCAACDRTCRAGWAQPWPRCWPGRPRRGPRRSGWREMLRNGKSSPTGQNGESHRSVLGAMAGLFGKSKAKPPARAGQSQPPTTRPEGRHADATSKSQMPQQIRSDEANKHFELGVTYGATGPHR